MDSVTFLSLSLEEKRAFCLEKIAAHSPGTSRHDELMVKVYQGLLELLDDGPLESDSALGSD
jgi:hypothetical protein